MNALELKINGTENSSSDGIIFNDYTPLWNAISAPGGYDPTGANCFDPNDIDTSTITVQVYSYVTGANLDLITIPPGTPVISDIGGTGYITYTLTDTDLGISGIADGIYKLTYSFDDNTGVTYTKVKYIACTNEIRCCLDQKLKAINFCPDCNFTEKMQTLAINNLLLDVIDEFLECENYTQAQEVLDYLGDFCNIQTCQNCG
jgi:hypothetical protein